MSSMYSILLLMPLVFFIDISSSQTPNCCLRRVPIQALTDGLQLQKTLINSKSKAYPFLPGKLINSSIHEVASEILTLMKQRDNLDVLPETPIVAAVKHIANSVITDACAYLVQGLDVQINCKEPSEVQSLLNKLEMFRMIIVALDDINFSKHQGSPKNRYEYWNTYVRSSGSVSPQITADIQKILRFVPNADQCFCE